MKLLPLVRLSALCSCCLAIVRAIPIPLLSTISSGQDVVIDGHGLETVWDASFQPLVASATANTITLRRATLENALLLPPTPAVPLALATNGAFHGTWHLEDLIIYVSACESLEAFSTLACDLQPAEWISSSGWSVTIFSFAGGNFTSSNVTLTCKIASRTSSPPSSSFGGRQPLSPAACVTLTAASPEELLAHMLYDAAQISYPNTTRLHISLTANISLDTRVWAAARPVLKRKMTTISGVNCRRVTAINLNGGLSLMSAEEGAVLRFICLEVSNLATDTLGRNMPRGLLSGAVWAVDVDMSRGSHLVVENCSLVLTVDEFKWQSYYMAQALINNAMYGSVSTVLSGFQGTVSPSQLVWFNVTTPHTIWRNCNLTSVPQVYDTTVPNSFIMRYLGLSLYLTDLKMVYSCNDLVKTLRPVPDDAETPATAAAARPHPPAAAAAPRAIILGANISIGACWPVEHLTVAAPSMMIMGLPDVTTILDLAGREDAIQLVSGASLSLRYLTLTGLSMHEDVDAYDQVVSLSTSPATSSAGTTSKTSGADLFKATALLWAFHFARRSVQVQLEYVTMVLPPVELEQYENMQFGSRGAVLPYFSPMNVYLEASSVAKPQPPPAAQAVNNASTPREFAPRVLSAIAFDSLLLPGVRGTDVVLSVWSGQYGNWSASLYDIESGGTTSETVNGSDGGRHREGLDGWRVGVLVAAIGIVAVSFVTAALLYGKRLRTMRRSGIRSSKRQGDLEAGGGGLAGTDAESLNASAGGGVAGGGGGSTALAAPRRPLYDSFDDPVFELDLVRGKKLSPEDVADILGRVNTEASEFNIQMTEICGSGAFGVVYGGMWHGIKVAIKTMVFSETAPVLMGGQLARQQCIREAAFCCTMHHPNVVATHHYYLKSAKRQNMFDDILQHMEDQSSDESERCRRRTPLAAAAITRQGNTAAATAAAAAVTLPASTAEGGVQAGEVSASGDVVAGDRQRAGKYSTGGRNPSAAGTPPSAGGGGATTAGTGTGAAPIRKIGPCRIGRSTLPKEKRKPIRTAVTDWRLYLIQEYCDGGTLRQAVDAGKIFRHSGVAAQPASTAGGGRGGGAFAGGGDGDAVASASSAAAQASARATKADGRSDSIDCVQTLMIIGKQCRVTYHRCGARMPANAAAAAGAATAADGGSAAAAAPVPAASFVPCPVSPDVADCPLLAIDAPEPTAPRLVALQQAEALCAHDRVSRHPTAVTLDSTMYGTTMTNVTPENDCVQLATTITNCGEVAIHAVQPPTPEPQPPPPAAAAAAAGSGGLWEPPGEVPLPADLFLVVHTALGIASGVAYLHSRNILHGDLSANNVLLLRTQSEQVPVVAKLSDFGLSMRLEQGQDHLKDVHHGTPYYQSPEVLEHGMCSLAADVYSLGVLLWELYHGPPPWRALRHKPPAPRQPRATEAAGPAEAAEAAAGAAGARAAADASDVWDDPNYRLRACDVLKISPGCPERFARLLRRCMSADPRDRPSARSVVKVLLRMERSLAAAAAAAAGDRTAMAGVPPGAVMALTRSVAQAMPGHVGAAQDATLLLEDFDVAASAVAAAVARVTAAPTAAGAPATAGATAAAVAAAAAAAGAASASVLLAGGHSSSRVALAAAAATASALQHAASGVLTFAAPSAAPAAAAAPACTIPSETTVAEAATTSTSVPNDTDVAAVASATLPGVGRAHRNACVETLE